MRRGISSLSFRGAPLFALLLLQPTACVVLGPTPAMTGVPAPPAERTSIELQAAAVPGYYLSETVQQQPAATQLPQLLGVLEPGELVGLPGALVGARYAGESDDGAALEPLLGYRAFLDEGKRLGLGAVGFFAYTSESKDEASFSAWRGGLEANLDVRLTGFSKYAELHGDLGVNLTVLDAEGRYCLDSERRYGVDCPDGQGAGSLETVSAALSGIFPSAHVGVSADFARHLRGAFHGLRLGLDLAGGAMPTMVGAEQRGMRLYAAGGLSLTVGVGASMTDK
jgi:hypothetical protein